jgi:hypothetical protein
MKTKKEQANLDLLDSIQRVEASPFLLTRIQEQIQSMQASTFSHTWTWVIATTFVVVIVLNLTTVIGNKASLQNENNIATSMNLLPNHNLYNE